MLGNGPARERASARRVKSFILRDRVRYSWLTSSTQVFVAKKRRMSMEGKMVMWTDGKGQKRKVELNGKQVMGILTGKSSVALWKGSKARLLAHAAWKASKPDLYPSDKYSILDENGTKLKCKGPIKEFDYARTRFLSIYTEKTKTWEMVAYDDEKLGLLKDNSIILIHRKDIIPYNKDFTAQAGKKRRQNRKKAEMEEESQDDQDETNDSQATIKKRKGSKKKKRVVEESGGSSDEEEDSSDD